jgi:Zn-dependent peptidase ImmA (M78 family)
LDYIKNEIDSLVKKYKTRYPFELCSALGVHVIKMDLHPEINGIYQYEKKNQFIYINSNLSYMDQLITCAHEVGHRILHKKMNCTFIKNQTLFNKDKIERAANIFAAYLLIPDKLSILGGQTIQELANELSVPVELLRLKLEGSNFFNY